MQTRSSPSVQCLHRLARQAAIPNFSSFPKNLLYRRLQDQFDIERLERAESRGNSTKKRRRDGVEEKAEDVVPTRSRKMSRVAAKSSCNFDPIMRTPLGKNVYTFVRPNGTKAKFNVDTLVDYLLTTGDFVDPESRLPFPDSDLKLIDKIVSGV
jgi:hypothetical protein